MDEEPAAAQPEQDVIPAAVIARVIANARNASEAKQSRAAFAALRASLDHAIAFAGALSPWQNLNFLPFPQGQGA